MTPGEFLCLLRKHKKPCFDACGVHRDRWGDWLRHEFAMPQQGTLWFSTPHWRGNLWLVPANGFPYVSVQDTVLSEGGVRYAGEVTRGWRSAMACLLEEGYLRPSLELSRLIGEDSYERALKFSGRPQWEAA